MNEGNVCVYARVRIVDQPLTFDCRIMKAENQFKEAIRVSFNRDSSMDLSTDGSQYSPYVLNIFK